MTHIALARKWRPRDFVSLVGQEHVVRALVHSLEQNRLHHAYLFTGTRGVGKTTLSRILAKALNCEKGVTATPCGACRACLEVEAGHCIDYIEMDAASNRGVDEMTALLEQAVYAPVAARFKVYMIDEVHMLTQHAFNAMLKTLEEPPPHVKFILATTDPKKVPITVLSRCLQFNLKPLTAMQITAHLEAILKVEQMQYTVGALHILSRLAQGSLRDALSLTDQAIAYSAGALSEEALQQMFGTLDHKYLVHLLKSVATGQGPAVLKVAEEMASHGASFGVALQDLASLLHRVAWAQYAPSAVNEMSVDAEDIAELASVLTPEQVQLYYQIATVGRSELGLAPDEYAGFTMTLLRMLAFYPSTEGLTPVPPNKPVPSLRDHPKLHQQEGATAQRDIAVLRQSDPAQNVQDAPIQISDIAASPSAAETEALGIAPVFETPASAAFAASQQISMSDRHSTDLKTPSSLSVHGAETPMPVPQNTASVLLENTAQWPLLVPKLKLRGLTEQLAAHSELIHIEGATLTLRVSLPQLAQKHCVEKLQSALALHFGQTFIIKTEIGVATCTAAQDIAKAQTQRQEEALESIQKNPVVQDLQHLLDASLVPGSVRAI